jgi:hypothetical protein
MHQLDKNESFKIVLPELKSAKTAKPVSALP